MTHPYSSFAIPVRIIYPEQSKVTFNYAHSPNTEEKTVEGNTSTSLDVLCSVIN